MSSLTVHVLEKIFFLENECVECFEEVAKQEQKAHSWSMEVIVRFLRLVCICVCAWVPNVFSHFACEKEVLMVPRYSS